MCARSDAGLLFRNIATSNLYDADFNIILSDIVYKVRQISPNGHICLATVIPPPKFLERSAHVYVCMRHVNCWDH